MSVGRGAKDIDERGFVKVIIDILIVADSSSKWYTYLRKESRAQFGASDDILDTSAIVDNVLSRGLDQ